MDQPDFTDLFAQQRSRLFGIAYRMVGSVAEAEDLVQESFIKYQAAAATTVIEQPSAWLRTITVRLCLDHLKQSSVQRESYVGAWLPEPLPDDRHPDLLDAIGERDTISLAFMLLLERLSPEERAVFLLREVFDYDYAEISAALEKSEAACRQLFSRAKKHLADAEPRFIPSATEHERLFVQFIQAIQDGDVEGLMSLLAEGIVVTSDGGGRVAAALRPVAGRDSVTRLLLGLRKGLRPDTIPDFVRINGNMAIIFRTSRGIDTVFAVATTGEQITQVFLLRNPDKLRHLG